MSTDDKFRPLGDSARVDGMRGFLKSSQGLFQLASKVTTVGREGCNLLVQVTSSFRL